MILNGGILSGSNIIVGYSYNLYNAKNLGDFVIWNNERWLVVDVQNGYSIIGAYALTDNSTFGDNNIYKGSDLENKCIWYEKSMVLSDSLSLAIDTTVLGTTHKIFIPESTCFSKDAIAGSSQSSASEAGTYAYYSSDSQRKYKTLYESTLSPDRYWTSSNNNEIGGNLAWNIGPSGAPQSGYYGSSYVNYYVTSALGFRPHVRVRTS